MAHVAQHKLKQFSQLSITGTKCFQQILQQPTRINIPGVSIACCINTTSIKTRGINQINLFELGEFQGGDGK